MSIPTYTLTAFNTATASENKIHDDTVAQRFGFTGGLVPGVEVAAYAAHPVVAHYGKQWFRGGSLTMRFVKPIYDGRVAEVAARETPEGLAIDITSDGIACANGTATGPRLRDAVLPFADPPAPRPAKADRPAADMTSLAIGRRLRSSDLLIDTATLDRYLADIRETDPLYTRDGVIHPGQLLRRCNAVLIDNVVLPPWVHVSSAFVSHAPGRVGQSIHADARVIDNYERKGHRLVDLDCHVRADDGTLLGTVLHSAIYRLRD